MVYIKFLKAINTSKPIVHVVMNNVTNQFVADALLAMACKPIMAIDPGEAASVTASADGLCINTGTPHEGIRKSYSLSMKSALQCHVPMVLDFPGLGSSGLRQDIAFSLLSILKKEDPAVSIPRIIRGNASELYCLADGKSHGGSIESIHRPQDIVDKCIPLLDYAPCLCISGPENYILGQSRRIIPGGHPFMSRSSGFGCVSSALMAAFLSCYKMFPSPDFPATAAAAVCSLMEHCSQRIPESFGPADFKNKFIDQIYTITEEINHREHQS